MSVAKSLGQVPEDLLATIEAHDRTVIRAYHDEHVEPVLAAAELVARALEMALCEKGWGPSDNASDLRAAIAALRERAK